MRRLTLVVALLSLISPLFAQQVGEKVVVIADAGAELKPETGDATTVPRGRQLLVQKVGEDRFFASSEALSGWISKQDVLPIDDALDYFTESLGSNPNPRDHVLRGLIWHEKGKYDNAIADYDEAIRLDPKFAAAYGNRAWAWASQGEYQKAIAGYSKAIQLAPNEAVGYCNRGYTWRRLGELDKAIADYSEAIRLDPKYFASYYARAEAWHIKSEDSKAVADLTEVIRLDPTDTAAHDLRGRTWKELGEYSKALEDFDEALRLDPKKPSTNNARAWFLATCPDPKFRDGTKALENATKACELTNWEEVGYIDTLAAAYAETGNFEEAVKWQTKALSMCEKSAKADFQSRLDLYKSGKPYHEAPKQ